MGLRVHVVCEFFVFLRGYKILRSPVGLVFAGPGASARQSTDYNGFDVIVC